MSKANVPEELAPTVPTATARSIPLAVPNVGAREAARVAETVASGWVSSVGPQIDEFEAGIASVSGVKRAAAVASGTMGLHVAFIAVGVRSGDLVACPSYTFAASANAICHAGAQPIFVDIDAATWTMSPESLAYLLETDCERRDGELIHRASGRRLSALAPVYTNGTPANMSALTALARRHRLPVVADAAAALGALYQGGPLGPLAELTVYSFNGNKTITTGAGGAVVGPDADLVKRVKHLSTTARIGSGYDHDEIGFNYRMSNIEAALGCVQLERLDEFLATKLRIRRAYNAAFRQRPGITPFPDPDYARSANWFSGVHLTPESGWTVPELVAALNLRGIGVRTFWKPMHMQPHFKAMPRTPLPVTEAMWAGVLPLPCSTSLSEEDQNHVIETLDGLLRERSSSMSKL